MADGNVKTELVGSEWRASYLKGGVPNQFGLGSTEEEAVENLRRATLKESANLGDTKSPPAGSIGTTKPTQVIKHEVVRVLTKKLQHPVEMNGKVVSWTAYRENDPSVQSYGADEQSAKVQFLTDEGERKKAGAKAPAKPVPIKS